MNGFDIVLVIAVILVARLGVRLITRYVKMKREVQQESQDKNAETHKEP